MTAARVTAGFVFVLATLLFAAGAAAEHGNRTVPALAQDQQLAARVEAAIDAESASDEQLAARVEIAIDAESALASARIDAQARAGVVDLRGSVASTARRADALRIARAVPGVRAVRDELRVAVSPGQSALETF